jgi:hypothetical protein
MRTAATKMKAIKSDMAAERDHSTLTSVRASLHASAYVSIRQHVSACVSIRQNTSAYVSMRQNTSACVDIRQHTSAYVSIRQHTSAYVSIRQHACGVLWHVEASAVGCHLLQLRQYLYFCTSKAITFVPIKQVSTAWPAEYGGP